VPSVRCSDDEHRGAGDPGEPRPAQEQRRHDGDENADQEHRRAVAGAEALDKALAPPLALLGLLDHLNDAADGVIGEGFRGLDLERALLVNGAGKDGVIRHLPHRDGFAGDRGLIQAGPSINHDAIGGDGLAWPDDEDIADR
jgi:hypothetical protein